MCYIYIYIFLCLLLVSQFATVVEAKQSPWDPFHANHKGILELPELPFDPNVIQDEKCKEDVFFWMYAVRDFVSGITQQCSANDTACAAEKQISMAKNMFAVQQVDSFGRIPVNLLNFNTLWEGSWEECMGVSTSQREDYRGQFCWSYVITPITNMVTGLPASLDLCSYLAENSLVTKWSVCMPRSCGNADITALLQTMNGVTQGELLFCSATCRPHSAPKRNAAFWVVTMYMAVAVLLMILASLIDYLSDCDFEVCKRLRSNTLMKCLLTFSLYTNGAEILSVQKRPGQIECLHCIRVVSMTWVMAGHSFMTFTGGDNLLQMLNVNKYFLNNAMTNAFFSVDSFLFLGGLLLTFLFMKEMTKSPNKIRSPVYWILYYVHRIVRLSVPYWLYIGFAVVYTDYMTQGPLEPPIYMNMDNCRKYWWKNIIYLSNLWSVDQMCLGHTWYLSIDMQIHVFAPILLVPLFFSAVAGSVIAYLLIVLSSCLCYWAYYKYDSPASFSGTMEAGDAAVNMAATENFQTYLYFAPWIRYTPYVLGALTGYIIHRMRGKKLRLNPLYAIGLWITAFALGIACVYGLYDYYNGTYLSKFEKATYYNFSRIGWSLALAWVIIACENNWAGPIKKLMEMNFWAPFSRLTYCAYLCHFAFVVLLPSMTRSPPHWVGITQTYILDSLPLFCISYVFAFLWSCVFEIPGSKLERMAVAALTGGSSRGAVRPAGHGGDHKAAIEPDGQPTKLPPGHSENGQPWTAETEQKPGPKVENGENYSNGVHSRSEPMAEKTATGIEERENPKLSTPVYSVDEQHENRAFRL